MKATTRLSLLLLTAIACIITLARAQDVNSTSTPTARHYKTGEPLQRSRETSIALMAVADFSESSVNTTKPDPWTSHLVAQLVKRSDLNRRQVQIILDAISLSHLFTAADAAGAEKTSANDALQGVTRRALDAFPKNEVAELFSIVNGDQSEQGILNKYYDLSALPLKGRKVSFRRASAHDKSSLWRTHFVLYLIKHPDLLGWQTEVIIAAMSLATPDYFAVPFSSRDWKAKVLQPSRLLENQIAAAFPPEEAAKIFATLGDDTLAAKHGPSASGPVLLKSIKYNSLGDSGIHVQWTHARFSQAVPENACECSTVSDYCPIWRYCKATGCSQTQEGCGTLYSYPCTGTCQ